MKKRLVGWMLGVLFTLAGCGGGQPQSAVSLESRTSGTSDPGQVLIPDGASGTAGSSSSRQSVTNGALTRKAATSDVPVAVYRFYNPSRAVHFYTGSETERDQVQSQSTVFQYEGPAFLAMPAGNTAYLAVHRFLNRLTGTHFYTSSETERASVVANLGHVYQYEGVAWRAKNQPAAGWVPMRRFYVAGTGVHFYTASEAEYSSLLSRAGFQYEGIAYYVRPWVVGGALDSTFGSGGRVIASLPSRDIGAAGSARLADGRLLVGGLCRTGDNHDYCVARYLENGSLDPSFGVGGWARKQVSTFRADAAAMAVLADGRILVGGSCMDLFDAGSYFCLVRFTAEGIPDGGFGTEGVSRFHASALPYGGVNDVLTDIVESGSATLVVTGECSSRFCAAKVLENGTLDPTYGTQGISTITGTGILDNAHVVRLDNLGRAVLAGACRTIPEVDAFCLRRLNADGTLDTSFGTNGKVRTVVGASQGSMVSDLHHLPDGGWLATGTCQMGAASANDFCAVRYSEDGVQDATYGSAGSAIFPVLAGVAGDYANASAVDADGKLVLAGDCAAGTSSAQFCAIRLYSNGALDATFGSNGRVIVNMPGYREVASAVLVDTAGRMVLSGTCSSSGIDDNAQTEICLARLLP